LLKGFESSKSDMLAKMNAVPKRERFPLVKGGVKAGQCGGVKVGHFWHKKVLGVTGSVASGA